MHMATSTRDPRAGVALARAGDRDGDGDGDGESIGSAAARRSAHAI